MCIYQLLPLGNASVYNHFLHLKHRNTFLVFLKETCMVFPLFSFIFFFFWYGLFKVTYSFTFVLLRTSDSGAVSFYLFLSLNISTLSSFNFGSCFILLLTSSYCFVTLPLPQAFFPLLWYLRWSVLNISA